MLLNPSIVEPSFGFWVWHKSFAESGLKFKILIWARLGKGERRDE
jgi:hypothetical protein